MKKPDYWQWHNYLPRKNIKKINELIESNSVDAKDRPADSKKTSQVKVQGTGAMIKSKKKTATWF